MHSSLPTSKEQGGAPTRRDRPPLLAARPSARPDSASRPTTALGPEHWGQSTGARALHWGSGLALAATRALGPEGPHASRSVKLFRVSAMVWLLILSYTPFHRKDIESIGKKAFFHQDGIRMTTATAIYR